MSRNYRLVIIALVALVLITGLQKTASGQTAADNFVSGFCNGNNGSNQATGVIPASVLSNQGGGEQKALIVSLAIILIMLMISSFLWLISNVFGLNVIKNMAKVEIGEVVITALIVFIFIGTFNIAARSVDSTNVFNAAGTNFGKGLFIDDCTYLTSASYVLIPPILEINVIRWVVSIVSSIKITVEPSGFGFAVAPFAGFILFNNVLAILEDITGAFLLLNMATVILIGIIYALFPIFLYAGIVLRTLPWTRAAGGAFLGVFVGFYIMFPLLLHVMLAGYIPNAVAAIQNGAAGDPSQFVSQIVPAQGQITNPAVLTNSFNQIFKYFFFINSQGIVGGYIQNVVEPTLFTFLAILIAFIISFDFAEATGDLLGAPSLTAKGIFNKII